MSGLTIVCEAWGGELPSSSIDCGKAVALALAALGPEADGSVRRLDFWFGDGCDRRRPCPERRPDVGWVIARSAGPDQVGVRLAIDPAGELRAWPPLPVAVESPPAFTAPRRQAPDLGPGEPASLREREPLPFCGSEELSAPDAFATAVRRCFLGGVLAGVPVEMISRSVSTEGEAVLMVDRFSGRGAIVRYVRADAAWTGSACGISPIATRAVFILAGVCEPLEP